MLEKWSQFLSSQQSSELKSLDVALNIACGCGHPRQLEAIWFEFWVKGASQTLLAGGLTECNNWRGITLMVDAAKVLGRIIIIITWIRDGIDKKKLRQEQAGFRKGRGTTEQIFILRNIIEQCNEWNSNLYVCFVDFEKAFDSVDRSVLWRIIRGYSIPEKIVKMEKWCTVGVNVL